MTLKKFSTLINDGKALLNSSPAKAFSVLEEAYNLAIKSKDVINVLLSAQYLGIALRLLGKYQDSKTLLLKHATANDENNTPTEQAKYNCAIANTLIEIGQWNVALHHLTQAEEQARNGEDKMLAANVIGIKARLFERQGSYKLAADTTENALDELIQLNTKEALELAKRIKLNYLHVLKEAKDFQKLDGIYFQLTDNLSKPDLAIVKAHITYGLSLIERGQYKAAREILEKQTILLKDRPRDLNLLNLNLSLLYLRINLLDEAKEKAQIAIKGFKNEGNTPALAFAQRNYGIAIYKQGFSSKGDKYLQKARQNFKTLGMTAAQLRVDFERATLRADISNEWYSALRIALRAYRTAKATANHYLAGRLSALLADIYERLGSSSSARKYFADYSTVTDGSQLPEDVFRVKYAEARISNDLNVYDWAITSLSNAIALASEEIAVILAYKRTKQMIFEDAIKTAIQLKNYHKVLDYLSQSASINLWKLYRSSIPKEYQNDAAKIEAELEALPSIIPPKKEKGKRSLSYSTTSITAKFNVKPTQINLATLVRTNELFISLQPFEEYLGVLLYDGKTYHWQEVDLTADQLELMVEKQWLLMPSYNSEFDMVLLGHKLYNAIFAKLPTWIWDYKTWLIYPQRIASRIPFNLLYTGNEFLVHKVNLVRYTGLASKFEPQNSPIKAMAWIPELPDAVQELAALAQSGMFHFKTENLAAIESVEACQDADIFHFAAHGSFREDNPLFSGIKLNDGWLTAQDIATLELNNSLVVLSVCDVGRNRVTAGDELWSVPLAWRMAGAANVIASMWELDDSNIAIFMKEFYAQIADGCEPEIAFHRTQRNLISNPQYSHPSIWASFNIWR